MLRFQYQKGLRDGLKQAFLMLDCAEGIDPKALECIDEAISELEAEYV